MNKRFIRMLEPRFRLCFVMLVLFALSSFFVSPWLAVAELAVVLIVYLQFRRSTLKRSREVAKFVEAMMYNVDVATKDSLINFPLPMAILKLESNEIIWYNDEFTKMTGSHERVFETHLRDVMPKLDLHWLIEGKRECPAMFGFGGKNYRILGNIVRPSDDGSKAGLLATLYWIDNTELVDMRHTFAKTRQIAAILMIDNFEEIMNGVADSGRNAILAAIDEKIAKWTEDVGGILLKSERDRYIFIFEERYLEKYREEKFNLLDAVREVESSNGIRPTLSIGVGKDGSSYLDNYKSAELAIEMSLSRGGDQAIIRNKFNFEFFGGHSAELEKRTKVKSRVMSNALAELIKDASNVLVMGHKAADNDSIGAAVGILAMARRLGRGGSIVVRHQDSNAEELYSMVSADEYYNDAFITAEDAMVEADGNTLLVVVDTNRPQYVESQALLESVNKVAVIDHHRRAAEYIESAVLNFHEPYASSTCELVAELLQYQVETGQLKRCESQALLAGIVLDSKNFTIKTGVRTFEAAAFLRRAGADTIEVKRLLQNDLETYVHRAEIVKTAKIYKARIAIAAYSGVSDRVSAAQAADDLLNITRVQASFVLYEASDGVIISARSLGNINVQIILEKLGGGGHLATAGAQIRGKSMQDVLRELTNAIDSVVEDE